MKHLIIILTLTTIAAAVQTKKEAPPKMVCQIGQATADAKTEQVCKKDHGSWIKDHTGDTRLAGDGCNTETCLDATCAYVSRTSMSCVTDHSILFKVNPPSLNPYPDATMDSIGNLNVTPDYKYAVDVSGAQGRVVRLSQEEYDRLEKLRKAVADAEQAVRDAERKMAEDHDVDMGSSNLPNKCLQTRNGSCMVESIGGVRFGDSYEFRGQFLLISLPKGDAK